MLYIYDITSKLLYAFGALSIVLWIWKRYDWFPKVSTIMLSIICVINFTNYNNIVKSVTDDISTQIIIAVTTVACLLFVFCVSFSLGRNYVYLFWRKNK